jgi:hypothetical protein
MFKQAPRQKRLNIVAASSPRKFTQGDDIQYLWNNVRGRQIRLNVKENNLFAV